VSVRPAIFYTIAFFILLPIYFWDRPSLKPVTLSEQQENLLKLSDITGVEMDRGSETLKFERTGGSKQFQVVTPAGKFIPQDLMEALTSLLLTQKQVEVVSENSKDVAQFGLDQPTSVMLIQAPGHPEPIKITFGAENPTHTAIYAQVAGKPQVFLLGKNIEYYGTLMFQWVEGKQGKNA
jgi:Domain of unknown function (DUF4340)